MSFTNLNIGDYIRFEEDIELVNKYKNDTFKIVSHRNYLMLAAIDKDGNPVSVIINDSWKKEKFCVVNKL